MRSDVTARLDADSDLVRGKIFCSDRCDFSDERLEDGSTCCGPDGDRSSSAADFLAASTWADAKRGITNAGMLPSIKR
jgi:hypothetical protein